MINKFNRMTYNFSKNWPLSLKGYERRKNTEQLVLAGDIGGTKTILAVFSVKAGEFTLLRSQRFASANYKNFIDILEEFILEEEKGAVRHFCLGVAGPVFSNKVNLTNLDYTIDADEIAAHFGLEDVTLINDLEATAYGLSLLSKENIIPIIQPDEKPYGNMAIIAPGTGLGEAGMYFDGEEYHVFPTEGGHCDFAPRTALDMAMYNYLQNKFGVVSVERVLSGPGIISIHEFLVEDMERPVSENYREEFNAASEKYKPAFISSAAVEKKEAVCIEAMEIFVRHLARESANLVLKMKATGGLFIGGGIPPKIIDLLSGGLFRTSFLDAGVMVHLIEKVPVYIIQNEQTALLGAANYAAFGAEKD